MKYKISLLLIAFTFTGCSHRVERCADPVVSPSPTPVATPDDEDRPESDCEYEETDCLQAAMRQKHPGRFIAECREEKLECENKRR